MTAPASRPSPSETINALPPDAAHAAFLKCCASPRWAAALTAARPFPTLAALLAAAARIFDTLSPADILEAISAHPRIGQRSFAAPTHAPIAPPHETWSAKEQSGMAAATDAQRTAFIAGNTAYEAKFNHVFLICATGRSATEMLTELHRRMANDPAAELAEATTELRKITLLRLTKLAEGT